MNKAPHLRGLVILHMRKFLEVRITTAHIYVGISFRILAFEKRCIKLSKAIVKCQSGYLWISSASYILNEVECFSMLVINTGAENIVHV